MLKGIDISSFQKTPNFDSVKNSGIDFVIFKATEGVGFTDLQFARNQAECRRVGLLIGYYGFVRPDLGNTPQKEADYFLKQIGDLQNGEILCLDFEVAYSDKVNWCKAWLDRVYEVTKVKPLIYLNKSTVAGNNWKPVIDAGYGLWLADYSYDINSVVPAVPWAVVAIRQWSNKETIPGISGGVDADVFYGDAKAFVKYGYKKPAVPDPCAAKVAEALAKQQTTMDSMQNTIDDYSKAVKVDAAFLNTAWDIVNPIATVKTQEQFLVELKALYNKANPTTPDKPTQNTADIQGNNFISNLIQSLLNKFI